VGREIKRLRPDLLVVRFWLPFMGPALGTILRIARQNKHSRIIAITDNVLPHEKRPGDKTFTRYFLGSCDGFITMSQEVMADLRRFEPRKPAVFVPHPLYDNFGDRLAKTQAREELQRRGLSISPQDKIILFFGFIRKYKGLDLLLHAMAEPAIRAAGIRLLVAGEFYEDAKLYLELVEKLHLQESLILKTAFIPETEVKFYLSACDAVIQPYRHATQSGVTPLAYHFEKPMIVTNVGGLPALVGDMQAGLVCAPDPASIARAILHFYELGENYFIPHLRSEKAKYTWTALVQTITGLAHDLPK
jgi:glycosyltransferase involved in cell wall biosynthesis